MKFIFNIEPQSQLRPRAAFNRYTHQLGVYDPIKTRVFKQSLRSMAKEAMHDKVFAVDVPLSVELFFYRPVQKSLSKKERRLRLLGIHRPTVKSDLDNYIKATLDSLNKILWTDDRQIVDLTSHKYYSDHPRIEVIIKKVDEKDVA
ncbi:RusA family crossover junction endodeoxyribonuclease [Limosilactobacillus antri]|uniref:RusA family crossover junction endodeoxyribonuclease n=1 Tax=Limosilactobacillus antri TaxID=227943 RepID=UPI001F572A27|nr:RusA family crossover junction endodeoxyribonuclease [Limosilactobacillus antri]